MSEACRSVAVALCLRCREVVAALSACAAGLQLHMWLPLGQFILCRALA